jgi:hypothetical protein
VCPNAACVEYDESRMFTSINTRAGFGSSSMGRPLMEGLEKQGDLA